MNKKICLQPCLGINDHFSTIGRQACYLVCQRLGMERTNLGCAPALFANVKEDVDFILGDWVVAVESCPNRCAQRLVSSKGGSIHALVRVDEVLHSLGFESGTLPREHAPLDHPAVVAVADAIVAAVRRIAGPLADELGQSPGEDLPDAKRDDGETRG